MSEATDVAENSVLPAPESIVYTIKKGSHTSTNNSFKTLKAQKLRFEVTFDSTAIYTSAKPENQYDINKLYGVSDCGSHHQVNSARIGWRWSNNQLELHAYTYKGGSRQSVYITSITLGKAALCELILEDGKYIFKVDGIGVELPRGCSGISDAYQLYPYFGGDEVAPHDINIKIRPL
ncbi:hypothetical protein ABID22_001510 [Pontibacter aydingkolensis]|uniref:Uncharacterized protein n=1 Tax=Pontibacter aydingkolensis TaxID=1911536 RepID=A0ABS7CTK6_9BACT|nr:hypothetical protein [Pontibacter aydingkolensis]MBW7467184.1 hypothetical protein [Pontibacter aydingkolensis]